jgi:hypothetical protein
MKYRMNKKFMRPTIGKVNQCTDLWHPIHYTPTLQRLLPRRAAGGPTIAQCHRVAIAAIKRLKRMAK